MPEWLKGTGCKPVGYAYAGSNPAPSITGRVKPVDNAQLAQLVEHLQGKEGVAGSSPALGSQVCGGSFSHNIASVTM